MRRDEHIEELKALGCVRLIRLVAALYTLLGCMLNARPESMLLLQCNGKSTSRS